MRLHFLLNRLSAFLLNAQLIFLLNALVLLGNGCQNQIASEALTELLAEKPSTMYERCPVDHDITDGSLSIERMVKID
jgi:hypothetical protein